MKSFYKIVATLSLLPLRGLGGFLLWTLPLCLSGQTSTENYMVGTVPYQATADPTTLTDANSNSTIQYFDGLGRPSQTVQRAITPTSADLVSGIEYDPFGRDYRHWLPGKVAGNSGAYVTDFGTPAVSTNGGDSKPYATAEYDGSPLNRVTGQSGPGADWYNNNKKKTIAYTTNGSDVKHYYVDGTQLKCDGLYSAATLYGQKTTDEDGKTVEEFTDKQGRKVLSRMTDAVAGNHDTYYVYDDLDNLRYVLPPLTADALGTNTSGFGEGTGTPLDQYGYIYHYDGRKRCTEKKLPGCDWIYMVYDLADRLILSQDGNQRAKAQWTVNKYDLFRRLLYSGLITSSNNRLTMESSYSGSVTNESYSGSGSVAGYTSGNLTPSTLLTVNYYDNYNFLSYSGNNPGSMLTNTTLSGYDSPAPTTPYAKTLLTGTRVYHLDNPSLFEVAALYYDRYGRIVQSRASNHLGGYDITYNALDFTGKPTKTYKTHGISGASATYTELYSYFYNKAQQLLSIAHQLNGGTTVILVANTYDELGRLSTKTSGGINAITHSDVTTYSYNVRNWTTGIAGSQFSENLYYNTNTANLPTFTPAYNGNIAGMQWSVPNESLGYNRAYTFGYDGLNHLKDANYCGFNGSVVAGTSSRYDEHFWFDKMGNITNFTRYGLQSNNSTMIYGKVDDLVLEHTGNQLMKVTDSGGNGVFYGDEEFMKNLTNSGNSCAYDANGNRLYDSNSSIWGIRYNILNLPDAMQFYQGHQTIYTYSAAGAKLKVVDKTAPPGAELPVTSLNTVLTNPSVSVTTTTDYVGNMIYENGALKRILTPAGYWQNGTYYYFLKDHLGSNRVVINGSGGVTESSSYYASGMRFGESAINGGSVQPHRHTGHEMQSMHGLNWIDNLARFRTVSDGSGFTGRDPLCEMKPWQSPYMYCSGNPVNRTDPTGLYDLPEVTVTAPAPKNNNNNNFNFAFQQLLDDANRNTPQIPRITPPTPTFNLPINPNTNNVVINNKDSKKGNGTLQNISDALTAAGMASGSFEVAVRNEAGKEIIYVTMKGTEAAVQSAKVLSVLKGIGTSTIVLGILVDGYMSVTGAQSWTKTGVNTGVAIVAGVIGGGPGLAIGATYYIVDKTIGWNRVLTPASNDQWVPNRAVFPDGSSTYVCFKAGTKILSKAGLKPIEQICIGDSVYSYNLDKNTIELNKVLKSFERKTQGIYELTTDNQKIFVTAEHPFYVEGKGWVKVKNIEVGEVLKTKDGSIERVTNIKGENYEGNVYNIEVEGNHNYFVTSSNILVHNK